VGNLVVSWAEEAYYARIKGLNRKFHGADAKGKKVSITIVYDKQ
jgi:hypothetical protein